MSIQAIFDKQALDFFPEVQQRIKEAGPFEANQMLNKCFGNAGIDVIMRHVVTDAISAPTQSQFT